MTKRMLLLLTVLVLTFQGTVYAQDATLTMPSATMTVGERVVLDVIINCPVTRCSALDLSFGYNPDLLRIDQLDMGDYWAGGGTPLPFINVIDPLGAGASFGVVTLSGNPAAPAGQGIALRITMTALAEGTFELRNLGVQAATLSGQPIPLTFVPGTITIRPQPVTQPTVRLVPQAAVLAVGEIAQIRVEAEQLVDVYGISLTCSAQTSLLSGQSVVVESLFDQANHIPINNGHGADGRWVFGASQRKPATAINGGGTAFTLTMQAVAEGSAEIACSVDGATQLGQRVTLPPASTTLQILPPPSEPAPPDGGTEPELVLPDPPPVEGPPEGELLPEESVGDDPEEEESSGPEADVYDPIEPEESEPVEQVRILSRIISPLSGVTLTLTGPEGSRSISPQPDGSIIIDQVAPGNYVLVASASLYLSSSVSVTVEPDTDTVIGPVSLPIGDVNGDGLIDAADALMVLGSFGQAVPPAQPEADLVPDGFITIADVTLLANHYGLSGPLPWTDAAP